MTLPCATTAATVRSARGPRLSHGPGARRLPSARSRRSRCAPARGPRPLLRGRAGSTADGRGRTRATPACPARTSRELPEPGIGGDDRRLDVAPDFRRAGQGADQAACSVGPGRDGHDLRDLTIAVEDDHRLPAGGPPNELARTVAKLADLDAF